jgi:SAM-dependent methyltransferase
MEREEQQRYYELGRSYWWLAGKYQVVRDVLVRHVPALEREPLLLDLGCGPGNFLDVVGEMARVCGSDYSADALEFCRERGYHRLFRADFHGLPVRGDSFDLITAIDVIEHLQHDRLAVNELARVLRPGGVVVLTVPAFRVLWGDHDDLYGHLRRYRVGEVRRLLRDAGLEVLKASYFEPLFFAPLWVFRNLKKLRRSRGPLHEADDFVRTPAWLNRLLTRLIAAERYWLRFASFPLGVTLVAVARKRRSAALSRS